MYSLVVLAVLIAASAAKPLGGQIVSVNQDTLGNYNLKYVIDGISRVEQGDAHGNVVGGYSYIDPYGILRKIDFSAGAHGFNAIGADIPQPVQDTPEVAHAKAEHLAVLNAAYLTAPRFVEVPAHLPGHSFVHGVPQPHFAHSNFLLH